MSPKLPPKLRKFDSGYEKRKKKKRINELTQSQAGALDKFLIKKPQIPIENSNVDNVNLRSFEELVLSETMEDNIDQLDAEYVDSVNDIDFDTTKIDQLDVDLDAENVDSVNDNRNDIFDPRIWDSLESKMIDLLASKGPRRDFSIVKGPKDKSSRRFTTNLGQLANEGFGDWAHVGERLREHEKGMEHVKNMTTWYELRPRLQNFQTIDKTSQRLINKEKDHWKSVLKRIISIVKFLAKHNLAFRGSNERLYQKSNGNFLGLIEMLAEFDPIVQEHVRRITNDNIHVHFLGHNI
ncbi:uncharacterized protein LOC131649779 [Vicia villosa]|uniref:uncharacterized protein LOC131649779 n=1 Tax=Vicia villosa TaxID=3911 RepID=UPI00273C75C7|nr:uncharacterized protein LOC131649779 [Vicia villosa]